MDNSTIKAMVEAIRKPEIHSGRDEDHKYAVIPDGMKVIDLRQYIGLPDRIMQVIETLSVDAFCAYLKRYANQDSVIFANEQAAEYEAVLDYHPAPSSDGEPSIHGEQDHRALYRCPLSDQWKTWKAADGKLVGQEEFATFIETNLSDIFLPSGADMLQMCLTLQVRKSATFESGLRLDSGQVQFRYTEAIKGTTNIKAGDIEIPVAFTLSIPVFVDGAVVEQDARFKYRMQEGRLSLGYDLLRPQETFRLAVKQVTAQIAEGAPTLPLFQGSREKYASL